MSKVAIEKNVLNWALERSGISEMELIARFPKIPDWMDGKGLPTFKQLEALAKKTSTPLGYFFLNQPPEEKLPFPHFRTLKDKELQRPSPDLIETVQLMLQRQAWMREFLIDQGQEKLPFAGSASKDESPIIVAGQIRNSFGLKEGWAKDQKTWKDALRVFRNAISEVGILVFVNGIVGNNTHRKLDPEEFRGFVLVDDYAPLVFVNGADGKAAQMFTLAHELAHIFLGSSAAFDLREMQPFDDPVEMACNKIAAEFLIPEYELNHFWKTARENSSPFDLIARRFKVSSLVAARRAQDLGLIERESFFSFYNNYLKDERRQSSRKPKGGDFLTNQNLRVGKRFGSAIIQSVREGKLLYSDAYQLTGLYGKTFDNFAANIDAGNSVE